MSEEHPHLHKTGHSRLDLMLAIAALLMSGVSLYIAMHHGHTMEKLVTAATWPHVQLNTSNADAAGGSSRVLLSAVNGGVGPARVQKAVMHFDGQPVTSAKALLKACCGPDAASPNAVVTTTINHLIIASQQQVDYLRVLRTSSDDALYSRFDLAREKIDTALCYCSVFDECWIAQSSQPEPRAVKSCEALTGAPYTD